MQYNVCTVRYYVNIYYILIYSILGDLSFWWSLVSLSPCRKKSKEQSIPIHLGLASSLGSLYLVFFLSPILANAGGEHVCLWVAPLLHYTLLTSLTWMSIEVFHTFWLVYMVFSPSPKPLFWNVIGFSECGKRVGIQCFCHWSYNWYNRKCAL